MSKLFEKLSFNTSRLGRLTTRDTEYWRMIFAKILKVGEEFEVHVPDERNLREAEHQLRDMFKPTHSVDIVGEYGIKEVTRDGSVPNGVEMITVGRRFNWKTMYEMNKKIMDEMRSLDFYTSYHTGMHIHLLAGYSSHGLSELEKNVPTIILANLYQLHRIFAPELYWIASAGATAEAMTRYTLFRQPLFDYSPINKPMEVIQAELNEKYGKYTMLNMNPSHFANSRELDRFHVEARYPDTVLSPAYATALVALEVAMIYKAIDLSQLGVILMKQEDYEERVALTKKFANYGGGERESDTSDIDQEDIEKFQTISSQMVSWFKAELLSISPIAYDILTKIAITPASLLRIQGKSWRQIEEYLYTPKLIDSDKKDKLIETIILQAITDCTSAGEWRTKAARRLNVEIRKFNELFDQIGEERIVAWDKGLGAMIFKQAV